MKTISLVSKTVIIIYCILTVASCDSNDPSPAKIAALEATEVTFNMAQLNASIEQVEDEIQFMSFIMTTNIDGSESRRSYELTLPPSGSDVSVVAKDLIPGQTYSYFLYVETDNSDLSGESMEFTTSEFPSNEFSFSPVIGGAETVIEIEGPFAGFIGDPDIRFYFPPENETWRDTYATGSVTSLTENRCEYVVVRTFVNESNFDAFNADLSIAINDKPYTIGKFQFTSRFYIEDEPPKLSPGETIRVVTENGRSNNVFEVNGRKLSHSAWLIANGIHENTVTIPNDFASGTYSIKVSSAEGNPLSLRPGPIYYDTFQIL